MLLKKSVAFRHKAVLTAAMLEELYNYPRDFVNLRYRDLSDGIIFGLDWSLDGDALILSAGAFKAGGEIYFMHDDLNVSDLAARSNLRTDGEYFIALTKEQTLRREPCLTESRLAVTFAEKFFDDTATLGRFVFKGSTRFKLPALTEGKDPFENIFRASMFNLVDVPVAAKGEPTFHPLIFRRVKKFLQSKPRKTFYDFALLTCLQNSDVLSVETLTNYLAEAGVKKSFGTRRDLLRNFCDALLRTEYRPVQAADAAPKERPEKIFRPRGKLL